MSQSMNPFSRYVNEIVQSVLTVGMGNVEVEMRFRSGGQSAGPVLASRLEERIRLAGLVPTQYTITDTKRDRARKRVTTTGGRSTTAYEKKEVISTIDDSDFDVRISVSNERRLTESAFLLLPQGDVAVRTMNRREYMMRSGSSRIDISDVAMGNVSQVEVELEMVRGTLSLNESVTRFIEDAKTVYGWFHDTVEIYTVSERETMTERVNRIAFRSFYQHGLKITPPKEIEHRSLVKARDMTMEDLQIGAIVGGPYNFTVSDKVDGVRKLIVLDETGLWLGYPPNEFNLIVRDNFPFTVIDGELVPADRMNETNAVDIRGHFYVPFDCMAAENDEVANKSHIQRMRHAQDTIASINDRVYGKRVDHLGEEYDRLLPDIIHIHFKEFMSFSSADEFFVLNNGMLDSQKDKPYKTDGLIYTPSNSVYNPGTQFLSPEEKAINKNPSILKWKPSEKLTIDFAISYINGVPVPMVTKEEGGTMTNVPFTPTGFKYDLQGQTYTADTVVEFAKVGDTFVPHIVRHDKRHPNTIIHANLTYKMTLKPISEQDMRGNSLVFMSRYHNGIKRDLLANKSGTLLDIGAGRGADVAKWSTFDRVIAVEPNEENVRELRRRLKGAPKVKVVQEYGQTDPATYLREKVDVIALMQSLTFFWESAEVLDALVNTIVTALKPGGSILFAVMNGNSVREMFAPTINPDIRRTSVTFNDMITIDYDYEQDGRNLRITMPNEIVGVQDEYLTNLNDLKSRLLRYGIEMDSYGIMDRELFLPQGIRAFSRLYCYGSFKHDGITELPTLVTKVMSSSGSDSESASASASSEGEYTTPSPVHLTGLSLQSNAIGNAIGNAPGNAPGLTTGLRSGYSPQPIRSVAMQTQFPNVAQRSVLPVSSNIQQSNIITYSESGFISVNYDVQVPRDNIYEKIRPQQLSINSQQNDLVRLATIGDSHCLIHAFLRAIDPQYQALRLYTDKLAAARGLRSALAKYLLTEVSQNVIGWELVLGSSYIDRLFSLLEGPALDDTASDVSIGGIVNTLTSDTWLGDESMALLSYIFKINIAVFRWNSGNLERYISYKHPRADRTIGIITYNNTHFELIGRLVNGRVVSMFQANDSILAPFSNADPINTDDRVYLSYATNIIASINNQTWNIVSDKIRYMNPDHFTRKMGIIIPLVDGIVQDLLVNNGSGIAAILGLTRAVSTEELVSLYIKLNVDRALGATALVEDPLIATIFEPYEFGQSLVNYFQQQMTPSVNAYRQNMNGQNLQVVKNELRRLANEALGRYDAFVSYMPESVPKSEYNAHYAPVIENVRSDNPEPVEIITLFDGAEGIVTDYTGDMKRLIDSSTPQQRLDLFGEYEEFSDSQLLMMIDASRDSTQTLDNRSAAFQWVTTYMKMFWDSIDLLSSLMRSSTPQQRASYYASHPGYNDQDAYSVISGKQARVADYLRILPHQ